MKATMGFLFFMLFLAGIAFVSLRGIKDNADADVISASQLTDVAWRPVNLGEMVVDKDTKMFIQFNDDGQISGHAGCNRFFGSYSIEDGKLEFGAFGATRMACQVAENALEIAFLEALGDATNAARVDRRLALRNDNGVNLLRFAATDRVDNP